MSALLDCWYDRQTASVINAADAVPETRYEATQELTSQIDHGLDLSIRRWSFVEPVVTERVALVDAERLAYLEALHLERGSGSQSDARLAAEAEYALFVGAQLLWPEKAHRVAAQN